MKNIIVNVENLIFILIQNKYIHDHTEYNIFILLNDMLEISCLVAEIFLYNKKDSI